MDRTSVIMKLRAHEPELKAAGILHLRVFGSTAREQAQAMSDVDLLAEFDSPRTLTLVRLGSLQYRLTDLLGTEVDLSSLDWMQEPIRSRVMREAILAF